MGRKRKNHESLQKLAPEGGTGKGHLFSVYYGEKVRGVMVFNSDSNPTSCIRSGPLPNEVTDDRGGSQTQACPLKPKLTEGDARVNAGGISEDKIFKVGVNPRDAEPESGNKRVGAERKECGIHWRGGQSLWAQWCS